MAASTVTARNTTAGVLQFPGLGVTIPALGTVTLAPGGAGLLICEILNDIDLQDAVNVGDVVLNDGTQDLAITDIFTNIFEDPTPGTGVTDADGDTSIEMELVADDDIIRFNVGDTPGAGPFTSVLTIDSGSGFRFNPSEEDLDLQVFGDSSGDALLQIDAGVNVVGFGRTSGSTLGVAAGDAFLQVRPVGGARSGAISIEPYNTGVGETSELRFVELAGGSYVGFKAPDAIAGNQIWTLPIADGTPNQSLVTDGLGNLGWASGPSSVTLQDAYDAGEVIAITDVDGPVEINDSPLTTDFALLRLDKDFAGPEPSIDIDVGASATGPAIQIVSATPAQTMITISDGASNSNGIELTPNRLVYDQNYSINSSTLAVDSGNGYAFNIFGSLGSNGVALAPGNGGATFVGSGFGGSSTGGVFPGGNGGNLTLSSGAGGGTVSTAGGNAGNVLINGGSGGPGVTVDGNGGNIQLNAGGGATGGGIALNAASSSVNTGGGMLLQSGDGGPGNSGGGISIISGDGGADPGTGAGAGGSFQVIAGDGDDSSGGAAGSGGAATLNGGDGGDGDATNVGADGGDIRLVPGVGGADGGAGAGEPGNVRIADSDGLIGMGIVPSTNPGRSKVQVQATPARPGAIELVPYGAAAGNTSELRFQELSVQGPQYVGFKAPDAVGTSVMWVLPNSDGALNEVLTTDGSGNLSWSAGSGGGTLQDAYDAGEVISITDVDGSVEINDASVTSGFSLLRLDKDFASTDSALFIDVGPASLGAGITVNHNSLTQRSIEMRDPSSGNNGIELTPRGMVYDQDYSWDSFTLPADSGGGFDVTLSGSQGGAGATVASGPGGDFSITSGLGGNGTGGAFIGGAGGTATFASGTGGTSAGGQGGIGGALNVRSGDGGAGTSQGLGGPLNLQGGTGDIGGNVRLDGGASSGLNPGGFSAFFGGPGGPGSQGGPVGMLGGNGGADTGSGAGGGGTLFLIAAAGSASAGNGSGPGGSIQIQAGLGGTGDATNPGGQGGVILMSSGNGASSASGGPPSFGGVIQISSGSGGAGSATSAGADGGTITISPGAGGADGGAGAGQPGSLVLSTGAGAQVGIGQTPLPGTGEAKLQVQPSAGQAGAIAIDPFGVLSGQTSELRFLELASSGSNYVGFKAPDSIVSDEMWTLPSTDGNAGDSLVTDGSNNLSWASAGGTTVANYYDAPGGQVINGAGIVLSYDTTRIQDGDYSINVPNTQVQINATGRYEIEAVTSCRFNSGGQRGTWNTVLQLDTGGGFNNIPGTVGAGYTRSASNQNTSVSKCIVDLTVGDEVRVFAQQVVGTTSATVPNGAALLLKRIS